MEESPSAAPGTGRWHQQSDGQSKGRPPDHLSTKDIKTTVDENDNLASDTIDNHDGSVAPPREFDEDMGLESLTEALKREQERIARWDAADLVVISDLKDGDHDGHPVVPEAGDVREAAPCGSTDSGATVGQLSESFVRRSISMSISPPSRGSSAARSPRTRRRSHSDSDVGPSRRPSRSRSRSPSKNSSSSRCRQRSRSRSSDRSRSRSRRRSSSRSRRRSRSRSRWRSSSRGRRRSRSRRRSTSRSRSRSRKSVRSRSKSSKRSRRARKRSGREKRSRRHRSRRSSTSRSSSRDRSPDRSPDRIVTRCIVDQGRRSPATRRGRGRGRGGRININLRDINLRKGFLSPDGQGPAGHQDADDGVADSMRVVLRRVQEINDKLADSEPPPPEPAPEAPPVLTPIIIKLERIQTPARTPTATPRTPSTAETVLLKRERSRTPAAKHKKQSPAYRIKVEPNRTPVKRESASQHGGDSTKAASASHRDAKQVKKDPTSAAKSYVKKEVSVPGIELVKKELLVGGIDAVKKDASVVGSGDLKSAMQSRWDAKFAYARPATPMAAAVSKETATCKETAVSKETTAPTETAILKETAISKETVVLKETAVLKETSSKDAVATVAGAEGDAAKVATTKKDGSAASNGKRDRASRSPSRGSDGGPAKKTALSEERASNSPFSSPTRPDSRSSTRTDSRSSTRSIGFRMQSDTSDPEEGYSLLDRLTGLAGRSRGARRGRGGGLGGGGGGLGSGGGGLGSGGGGLGGGGGGLGSGGGGLGTRGGGHRSRGGGLGSYGGGLGSRDSRSRHYGSGPRGHPLMCNLCQNHGLEVKFSPMHKRVCPYFSCCCDLCIATILRQTRDSKSVDRFLEKQDVLQEELRRGMKLGRQRSPPPRTVSCVYCRNHGYHKGFTFVHKTSCALKRSCTCEDCLRATVRLRAKTSARMRRVCPHCERHNLRVAYAYHKCPFADCACVLCYRPPRAPRLAAPGTLVASYGSDQDADEEGDKQPDKADLLKQARQDSDRKDDRASPASVPDDIGFFRKVALPRQEAARRQSAAAAAKRDALRAGPCDLPPVPGVDDAPETAGSKAPGRRSLPTPPPPAASTATSPKPVPPPVAPSSVPCPPPGSPPRPVPPPSLPPGPPPCAPPPATARPPSATEESVDAISAFLLNSSAAPEAAVDGRVTPIEDIDLEALLDDLEEEDFGSADESTEATAAPPEKAVADVAKPPKKTALASPKRLAPTRRTSPRRPPVDGDVRRPGRPSLSSPRTPQRASRSPRGSPRRGSPRRGPTSRPRCSATSPRTPRTPPSARLMPVAVPISPASSGRRRRGAQRSPRQCQLCRNHGLESAWGNGHARECPYRTCDCEGCRATLDKRRENAAYRRNGERPARAQRGLKPCVRCRHHGLFNPVDEIGVRHLCKFSQCRCGCDPAMRSEDEKCDLKPKREVDQKSEIDQKCDIDQKCEIDPKKEVDRDIDQKFDIDLKYKIDQKFEIDPECEVDQNSNRLDTTAVTTDKVSSGALAEEKQDLVVFVHAEVPETAAGAEADSGEEDDAEDPFSLVIDLDSAPATPAAATTDDDKVEAKVAKKRPSVDVNCRPYVDGMEGPSLEARGREGALLEPSPLFQVRYCAFCRNHDKEVKLRGHKGHCPYRYLCDCAACRKRNLMLPSARFAGVTASPRRGAAAR
ncbi:uncharacterized protein LOC117654493 [Thrips palmi]|uniref:Uncharacterized protein LOC117654493 n=1 Tax=Thrips palmi TaxID=161013 RepID=A0A6P9AHZ7_THRPL|nr:uncharacterized protein LOC117654493 [Thrips palmi]